MTGRISAATERAIKRVLDGGESQAGAARAEHISRATLFRALKRIGSLPRDGSEVRRYVIVGAGALGREVAQWLRVDGRDEPIVFLDDFNEGGDIIGNVESYERRGGDAVLIAIADPNGRRKVGDAIAAATWVASSAVRGHCTLGEGTLLLPGAVVSTAAVLGECCIVNINSSIGHDVELGSYCTLSSHVDLCGRVTVGHRVFFGSGARVIPGVRIGDDAHIGAGAVVVKDVPARARVFGNPAREVA